MHLILYLRKSREDIEREKQTGEDTLAQHRARMTTFLVQNNHTWIERPEVRSGDTIASRPIFQQVLYEDIPSGLYQGISITEISRLGRGDMADAGIIYNTIVQNNFKIVTPVKTYDPQNAADLRQIRFELFLSREEFLMIKERLDSAREYRATNGYPGNCISALGYSQARGKVFVVPEEAEIVREIFEMRTEGKAYNEIAEILNSRGLRSKRGAKFRHTTIAKIISNRRYIGLAKWRDEYYESKAPIIVSQELWNRVHCNIQPNLTHFYRAPEDRPYFVRLYCKECGNIMYGERETIAKVLKSGEKRIYKKQGVYVCTGRKKEVKCNNRQKMDFIHNTIYEILVDLFESEYWLQGLQKDRNKYLKQNEARLDNIIHQLKQVIKEKELFINKLENDYKKGDLGAILFDKLYNEASKELKTLKSELKKTSTKKSIPINSLDDLDIIKNKLSKYLESWEQLPSIKKKIIVSAFLPNIEIDKEKHFKIHYRCPLESELPLL